MIRDIKKLIKHESENIETHITPYNRQRGFSLSYSNGEFSFHIYIEENDEGRPPITELIYNGDKIELNTFQCARLKGTVKRTCYKNHRIKKDAEYYNCIVKPKNDVYEYIKNHTDSTMLKARDCVKAICENIDKDSGLFTGKNVRPSTPSLSLTEKFYSSDGRLVLTHSKFNYSSKHEVSMQFDKKFIHLTESEEQKIIRSMERYFERQEQRKQKEREQKDLKNKSTLKSELREQLERR